MAETEDRIVHVVDDDEGLLKSTRFLLESVGMKVETYSSARQFLDEFDDDSGCIVLDVRMPGMSGLELMEVMQERGIHLPVIIVTGHGDTPMAVRAMKAGARDFIQKPPNDQELIDTIKDALARDAEVGPVHERGRLFREREATLSDREREVMGFVIEGTLNKNIASELNLSEKTIEVHRSNMMKKMKVQSVAELVRLAVSAELAEEL